MKNISFCHSSHVTNKIRRLYQLNHNLDEYLWKNINAEKAKYHYTVKNIGKFSYYELGNFS